MLINNLLTLLLFRIYYLFIKIEQAISIKTYASQHFYKKIEKSLYYFSNK